MPHIHEKIDFTAEAFIVYGNKVLLRMHDKYKIWLSVGGHIELNEDPNEALIREVKEEVGLDIELVGEASGPLNSNPENRHYRYLVPPKYMGRHPVSEIHEHVSMVYFARALNDKVLESQNLHERTETVWVTKEEMDKMDMIPNVRFYAEQALKELGK